MTQEHDIKISADLELTDPGKVWWPEDGITKADVISYYTAIAQVIMPYLKGRPMTLRRFSEGIANEGSYVKNMNRGVIPLWVHTELLYDASGKETISWLVCDDKPTLQYIINLGCISLTPWHSKTGSPEHPDWAVIDLVSDGLAFTALVDTALALKKICEEAGVECYCKTAGDANLHIYIPLGAKYLYEQAREFARSVAQLVNRELPGITTLERAIEKRRGRVYLDILLNDKEQVLEAPYSVLPLPGAPVSTPLEWNEVKHTLEPSGYHIRNIEARLKDKGDLWKPVAGKGINLEAAIEKLEVRMKKEE